MLLKAKLITDEKHVDIFKLPPELIEENYDSDINDTEKNKEDRDLEVEVEEDFDIIDKVEEYFDNGDVIFTDYDEDIEKE